MRRRARQRARGHPLLEVRDRRLLELERGDGDGLRRRPVPPRARPTSAAAPATAPHPRKLRRFIAPPLRSDPSRQAPAGLALAVPARHEPPRLPVHDQQRPGRHEVVLADFARQQAHDAAVGEEEVAPGGSPSTKERTRARRSSKVSPDRRCEALEARQPLLQPRVERLPGAVPRGPRSSSRASARPGGARPRPGARSRPPAAGPRTTRRRSGRPASSGRSAAACSSPCSGERHVRPARQRPPLARRRLAVAHQPQLACRSPLSWRRVYRAGVGGKRGGTLVRGEPSPLPPKWGSRRWAGRASGPP